MGKDTAQFIWAFYKLLADCSLKLFLFYDPHIDPNWNVDIKVLSFFSFHPSCQRKATAYVGDWRVASFGHTWASSPETIWHNGTSVRMIFSQNVGLTLWNFFLFFPANRRLLSEIDLFYMAPHQALTLVITCFFKRKIRSKHTYSSVTAPSLSL